MALEKVKQLQELEVGVDARPREVDHGRSASIYACMKQRDKRERCVRWSM